MMIDETVEVGEPESQEDQSGAVGKSSIVSRFWRGTFNEAYSFTVGIDFYSKTLKTKQQKGSALFFPSYLRDAAVAIVCFDITNVLSFQALTFWTNYVKQRSELPVRLIVIGTKLDLKDQRKVDRRTAEKFCEQQQVPFFEVSAKTGDGIEELFTCVADFAVQQQQPPPKRRPRTRPSTWRPQMLKGNDRRIGVLAEVPYA
ncbi:putative Ras oncogene family protein [Aphelenchoides fujianensis]|nr:putative Ras oncogene family protein [Aphelenchoides fujianensis]